MQTVQESAAVIFSTPPVYGSATAAVTSPAFAWCNLDGSAASGGSFTAGSTVNYRTAVASTAPATAGEYMVVLSGGTDNTGRSVEGTVCETFSVTASGLLPTVNSDGTVQADLEDIKGTALGVETARGNMAAAFTSGFNTAGIPVAISPSEAVIWIIETPEGTPPSPDVTGYYYPASRPDLAAVLSAVMDLVWMRDDGQYYIACIGVANEGNFAPTSWGVYAIAATEYEQNLFLIEGTMPAGECDTNVGTGDITGVVLYDALPSDASIQADCAAAIAADLPTPIQTMPAAGFTLTLDSGSDLLGYAGNWTPVGIWNGAGYWKNGANFIFSYEGSWIANGSLIKSGPQPLNCYSSDGINFRNVPDSSTWTASPGLTTIAILTAPPALDPSGAGLATASGLSSAAATITAAIAAAALTASAIAAAVWGYATSAAAALASTTIGNWLFGTLSITPIVVRRLVDTSGALTLASGSDYDDADNRSIQFGVPSGFTSLSGSTPNLDITPNVGGVPSPTPATTIQGTVQTGSFTIGGVTYTTILDFQPTAAQTALLTNWSPNAYFYRVRAVWTSPAKTIEVVDPSPCTALW